MMTRKDYVAVAEILSGYKEGMIDIEWFNDLVEDFAELFEEDNPNFKIDKFKESCNKITHYPLIERVNSYEKVAI